MNQIKHTTKDEYLHYSRSFFINYDVSGTESRKLAGKTKMELDY